MQIFSRIQTDERKGLAGGENVGNRLQRQAVGNLEYMREGREKICANSTQKRLQDWGECSGMVKRRVL